MRGTRLIVAFGAVVLLLSLVDPAAGDPVDDLLSQLASDDFDEREQAQSELSDRASKAADMGGLTSDEVKKVREAARQSDDPEIRHRASAVFSSYINTIMEFQMIKDLIGVKVGPPVPGGPGLLISEITVGNTANGQFGYGDTLETFAFDLQSKANKVVNTLQRGATEGAAAATTDLKSFIGDPANEGAIQQLQLRGHEGRIRQEQLVARMMELMNKLPALTAQINGTAGTDPDPPKTVPVESPGEQPTGKTFKLEIEQIPGRGALDIFIPLPDTVDFLLPRGYELVGQVFDVTPTDELLVTGAVNLKFQFGPTQLIGNPVRDAAALQIVRFSDTGLEFLNITNLDLANHTLAASYLPLTSQDQFGQFSLVQLIPEPHCFSLALMAATMLLAGRRRHHN